jgi:hypothetical protein
MCRNLKFLTAEKIKFLKELSKIDDPGIKLKLVKCSICLCNKTDFSFLAHNPCFSGTGHMYVGILG